MRPPQLFSQQGRTKRCCSSSGWDAQPQAPLYESICCLMVMPAASLCAYVHMAVLLVMVQGDIKQFYAAVVESSCVHWQGRWLSSSGSCKVGKGQPLHAPDMC